MSRKLTTPYQFEVMVGFMEKNGDICKPADGLRGRVKAARLWKELTILLNRLGRGEGKPEDKWRKVWADLKSNVKKKFIKIEREGSSTGGSPPFEEKLSELEKRILSVIHPLAVNGMDAEEVLQFGEPEVDIIIPSSASIPCPALTSKPQPYHQPSTSPAPSSIRCKAPSITPRPASYPIPSPYTTTRPPSTTPRSVPSPTSHPDPFTISHPASDLIPDNVPVDSPAPIPNFSIDMEAPTCSNHLNDKDLPNNAHKEFTQRVTGKRIFSPKRMGIRFKRTRVEKAKDAFNKSDKEWREWKKEMILLKAKLEKERDERMEEREIRREKRMEELEIRREIRMEEREKQREKRMEAREIEREKRMEMREKEKHEKARTGRQND